MGSTTGKIVCALLISTLGLSVLTGCGDDDASDFASKLAQAGGAQESDDTDKGSDKKEGDAVKDMADKITAAANEKVDEAWIEVLKENGTFYDAFYNYRKILKEEEPNHPDNVKMPDGIIKENNDYYIPDMEVPETKSADMSELVGRWRPVTSSYMDIDTDWTWARDADVDFHLDLNEDGTSSCNMFGGDQEAPWNEKIIPINGQDCEYGLVGDNLVLHRDMGLGAEMVYTFERDNKSNAMVRAHEDDVSEYLGHPLPDGKVYRLARIYENGKETKVSTEDAETSPDDHFVVMVETDEEAHSGYGYMRSGITDTALYYESERELVKLINEDTKDRSGGMGRTKFEMEDDGELLRLWPGYMGTPDKYYEYELSEDEEAPISHLAVGPNPDRNFEIPGGTHEKAGFWRLDKIYNYTYVATDPFMEGEIQPIDDNVYGTDSRKYDADVWYVLREDGTGYMRVWNRYFEVVWDDDGQYYYDISGRHKMGTVVGELDYDGTFMRMFKDEINEVPEYPEELKDK